MRDARHLELLGLGMFGRSQVRGRIEMLLQRGRVFSARTSWARVVVSVAAMAGLVISGANAPRWIAFAQTRPAFEIASVKAIKPGTHAEPSLETSPIGLTARAQTVRDLVMWAYQVRDTSQISGPDWMNTQPFDLTARAAAPVATEQLRLMLQTLLDDRFKLVLRREQRIVPLYSLVVGKDGVKLHAVQQEPRQGGRIGMDAGGAFHFEMVNHVSELARVLPDFLDNRPVEDKTGLTGVYEIPLVVQLEESQRRQMPQPGLVFSGFGFAPAVFDAVERMGLKLESAKGPVEFLVIDHVERPNEN